MQSLPIVVINLERATHRRAAVCEMMDRLGLEFEFSGGIDGAELTPVQLSDVYSPFRAFLRLGRHLHVNEVGCTLSHVDVWRRMVRENIPELLVLEDDAVLGDAVPRLIATRHEWMPRDARVVYLAHDMAAPFDLVPIRSEGVDGLSVCTFRAPVMRCAAYIIRLPAAVSLLAHSSPVTTPPDDLLGHSEFTGGGIYGVVPKPATWDDDHPSTIWGDTNRDDFAQLSRGGLTGLARRLLRRAVVRDKAQ